MNIDPVTLALAIVLDAVSDWHPLYRHRQLLQEQGYRAASGPSMAV